MEHPPNKRADVRVDMEGAGLPHFQAVAAPFLRALLLARLQIAPGVRNFLGKSGYWPVCKIVVAAAQWK
jgi:hypothetical protein